MFGKLRSVSNLSFYKWSGNVKSDADSSAAVMSIYEALTGVWERNWGMGKEMNVLLALNYKVKC